MEPVVRFATTVVAAVLALLVVTTPLVVGRERLAEAAASFRSRVGAVFPYVVVLGVVLAVNKGLQSISTEISWAVDLNVTPLIYDLEGGFVAWLQGLTPPSLVVYFSAVYVVGYAFLLSFPVVAYACLPSPRRLKQLLVAYGINYGCGVVLYTLVVAYGPRNMMPETVGQPLYDLFPQSMQLTAAINTNTNVFPSLHASLSVTVLLFAWLSRDSYPRWYPLAALLSTSVVLSTMVLGIHWLTDVLAGIVLGVASVRLSEPLVDRIDRSMRALGWLQYDPDPSAW